MGKQQAAERVPCDCPIEILLEAARGKLKKFKHALYSGYIPWDKTSGFLFCDKHRVYCRITHDPLSPPAPPVGE